ncbi:hypothetical protein EMIT0111MI5_190036 [Burkholderia sp. IT-111MI5]
MLHYFRQRAGRRAKWKFEYKLANPDKNAGDVCENPSQKCRDEHRAARDSANHTAIKTVSHYNSPFIQREISRQNFTDENVRKIVLNKRRTYRGTSNFC